MRNETSRAMIELEKRGVRLSVNDGRLRFAGADVEDSDLVGTVRSEEVKVACEVLWEAERDRLDALYPPALVRAAHTEVADGLAASMREAAEQDDLSVFEDAVARMRRHISAALAPTVERGAK